MEVEQRNRRLPGTERQLVVRFVAVAAGMRSASVVVGAVGREGIVACSWCWAVVGFGPGAVVAA